MTLTLAKLKAAVEKLKTSRAYLEDEEMLLPVHPDKIPLMIEMGFTQREDGVWLMPERLREGEDEA